MKRSTLYGAFLTLLMFWLVVVAIVVFLFQARSNLNEQVADLNSENEALNDAVTARDDQLAITQSEQALTVQNLSTREAELAGAEATAAAQAVEIEGQTNALASLSTEVSSAQATASALEAEQEAARMEPPQVELIAPTEFEDLNPGEETLIIFSASDPAGVNLIALDINGEPTLYQADGAPLMTVSVPWTPEEEGQYTISVSATDVDGQSSVAIELFLTVIDESAINDEIRALVEANVVEIRGLPPLMPVEPSLLTQAELSERVNNDFFADFTPEDGADVMLVFCAFDFGDCDYDYYEFILSLYSGAVAGFYDPETDELVVISEGGILNASEQLTHAHEFMHAIQDQYYNLERISDESLDSEARFALRALAEGEAELIETLYFAYLTDEQIAELSQPSGGSGANPFEGVPIIFLEQFIFPYVQGADFVETLYEEGDNTFVLIDEAWVSPPLSTEHILHPERYLSGDLPEIVPSVALTDTLGTGWRLLDDDVFGEFVLWRYLNQGLPGNIAADAAEGWGGDRYAVYYNDESDDLVMTLRTVWDSEEDNAEFLAAYESYGDFQFGTSFVPEDFPEAVACWQPEDGLTCLISEDELTTTIIRAPSLEMVEAIWAEIQ